MSASKQPKETVIRHRNVFTGEIVEEVIVKKPKPRRVQPQRYYSQRQRYVYGDNDIVEWFKSNAPETLAEVEDLRRALKTRKRAGKYDITIIFTQHTGRRLIKVWGPKSQVVIVSQSSRKLFNKKLRNREIYLEELRDQFGQW
ncbi:hypothetical protein [Afipia sp. 1NLS2]|jgi:hypothetical protein|uniref:hypothetical protein n=1 Tax=Afipia sp. 1NLS2 TaxID=666684 RepID=UPI0001DA159F|nr:hypothetical protein [Afipia sp. 1NLS2]EFI53589.1 hypothetical protein AfiDRAFT_1576 [Afipia sp. 1NLS2]